MVMSTPTGFDQKSTQENRAELAAKHQLMYAYLTVGKHTHDFKGAMKKKKVWFTTKNALSR